MIRMRVPLVGPGRVLPFHHPIGLQVLLDDVAPLGDAQRQLPHAQVVEQQAEKVHERGGRLRALVHSELPAVRWLPPLVQVHEPGHRAARLRSLSAADVHAAAGRR